MSNPAAIAKLGKLAVSAANASTSAPAATRLFFTSFKPGCKREKIDIGENVGGFSDLGHPIELTRQNITRVAPTLSAKPSTAEWKIFLDWIMNATPTGFGTTLAGGGTGPYIWATPGVPMFDRTLEYQDTQKFWHMSGIGINRAILTAEAGKELQLTLEMQGIDYNNTGTFPTLSYTASLGPRFLFGDQAVLVTGIGTPVRCRKMTLTIDHSLINDRFFYGFTSAGPVNTDRKYELELEVPYGIHNTLVDLCAVDGGVAGSMTFTYGASVMIFTMPKLRSDAVSVDMDVARDEMFLPWKAQAFDDATTPASGFQASLVL